MASLWVDGASKTAALSALVELTVGWERERINKYGNHFLTANYKEGKEGAERSERLLPAGALRSGAVFILRITL